MTDTTKPPKVFISYAWENDTRIWVRELATRLRSNGVHAILDQWDVAPGDSLPEFMEISVSASDFVLVVCTPAYKRKSDSSDPSGVGYEKGVITGELFVKRNQRKFIPILRKGKWLDAAPSWVLGKNYIDLRGRPYSEDNYQELLRTIYGKRIPPPPLGNPPDFLGKDGVEKDTEKAEREAVEKVRLEAEEKIKEILDKINADFRLRIESGKKTIKSMLSSISTFSKKIATFAQKHFKPILFLVLSIAIYLIWELNPSIMSFFIPPTSTFTPTLTLTITPLSTSTKIQTSTPVIITPTITFTPTITNTPTPFPASITDNKGIEMALIPAGTFIMGYDKGSVAEDPQGERFVDAFYIDKYEITNELYKECVADDVCEPPNKNNSNTHIIYYGNSQFNDYPVINVDWHMAVAYCSWRDARLPTEPEWEKAARGDDGRIYPWGNQSSYSYANYYNYKEDTTAVGSYETGKSVYGVYDMAGNVREWVSSLFVEYPYKTNDGRENPDAKGARTFRGGAWSSASVTEIRTSYRSGADPSSSFLSLGFRCARSVPEIPIPESISGTVSADNSINCRLEPNLEGQIIDFLQPNSSVTIFGRLSDSSWLLVKIPGVESCWVSAPLITVTSGNLGDLPVNTVYPTSTVTP